MDDLGFYILMILSLIGMYIVGVVNGLPDQLDNGCIIHDNAVYCEVAE